MIQCKCGSHAINHHLHGRDGSEPELCDVCYWRKKYEIMKQRNNELLSQRNSTGVAIDNAMRGILPDEHPMPNRLKMIANVAMQRDNMLYALKKIASVKPSLMRDESQQESIVYYPYFNPFKIARDALSANQEE